MLNFDYQNTTRVVFGAGSHRGIGGLLKSCATKVLLHYGGGSVKRTGLYDEICASLGEAGIAFVELGGVQPNPEYDLVQQGIRLCREEGVDCVLAVGGGSVIDSAKSIAMGVPYEGDVWDFFVGAGAPKTILSVVTVLTLPAAGSEQSPDAVLTHEGRKVCAIHPGLRPVVSVINPELFYTLPKNQIANGICDMMCHVMERYFTITTDTQYIDGLCESTLRTLVAFAPQVLENSCDYNAWSQLALAGSYGHTGFLGVGRREDWACHAMEHAISAADPSIAHGAGLAVLYPVWMREVCGESPGIFLRFAEEVMGVDPSAVPEGDDAIGVGIAMLRAFFSSLGLPSTLRELGVQEEQLEPMARKATGRDTDRERPIGGVKLLCWQDVLRIYRAAWGGEIEGI